MSDSYLNYARVCDLEKTWVLSLPWCKESPTGVWIDIFPIDGVKEDTKEEDFVRLESLRKKQLVARNPKNNLRRPMPFSRYWRSIAMKCIFFWTDIDKLIREYEQCVKRYDYGTTHLCGNKSILNYYAKEAYPTSLFDSYTDVVFEGCTFKSLSRYDEYLKTIFGDYMQLPPMDQRVRHPLEMYWR